MVFDAEFLFRHLCRRDLKRQDCSANTQYHRLRVAGGRRGFRRDVGAAVVAAAVVVGVAQGPPLCCGGCGLTAPLGGQEKEEEEEANRIAPGREPGRSANSNPALQPVVFPGSRWHRNTLLPDYPQLFSFDPPRAFIVSHRFLLGWGPCRTRGRQLNLERSGAIPNVALEHRAT